MQATSPMGKLSLNRHLSPGAFSHLPINISPATSPSHLARREASQLKITTIFKGVISPTGITKQPSKPLEILAEMYPDLSYSAHAAQNVVALVEVYFPIKLPSDLRSAALMGFPHEFFKFKRVGDTISYYERAPEDEYYKFELTYLPQEQVRALAELQASQEELDRAVNEAKKVDHVFMGFFQVNGNETSKSTTEMAQKYPELYSSDGNVLKKCRVLFPPGTPPIASKVFEWGFPIAAFKPMNQVQFIEHANDKKFLIKLTCFENQAFERIAEAFSGPTTLPVSQKSTTSPLLRRDVFDKERVLGSIRPVSPPKLRDLDDATLLELQKNFPEFGYVKGAKLVRVSIISGNPKIQQLKCFEVGLPETYLNGATGMITFSFEGSKVTFKLKQ